MGIAANADFKVFENFNTFKLYLNANMVSYFNISFSNANNIKVVIEYSLQMFIFSNKVSVLR